METLTLEHLSAYLPFDLELEVDNIYNGFTCKLVVINNTNSLKNGLNINEAIEYNAKPILYPLSSLTETIWYEGKEINPIEFIKDWYNESYGEIDDLEYYELENEFALFGTIHPTEETELEIIAMPCQAYQLLFKMKIDIFSLIEKGLAVDVNALETNPYK
jgi:hypothetical protein